RQPQSALFPYTTLFRSSGGANAVPGVRIQRLRKHAAECARRRALRDGAGRRPAARTEARWLVQPAGRGVERVHAANRRHGVVARSEEHTSELQSRETLV